jgi:hypothetical protein
MAYAEVRRKYINFNTSIEFIDNQINWETKYIHQIDNIVPDTNGYRHQIM